MRVRKPAAPMGKSTVLIFAETKSYKASNLTSLVREEAASRSASSRTDLTASEEGSKSFPSRSDNEPQDSYVVRITSVSFEELVRSEWSGPILFQRYKTRADSPSP